MPVMQEYSSVSASSFDPPALVAKLNDAAAEGWSVVSVVSAGSDLVAVLSRAASGASASAAPAAAAVATAAAATAVAEPAGWGVAPEPEPTVAPTPAVSAQPTPTVSAAPAATAAATTPAVPSGWYADPSGRYELRYWDGGTWTEHVSRAGQQYTDPPVA